MADLSRSLAVAGGGGSSVYGSKVKPIVAPNPFEDLSKVYPNLGNTNSAVSADILAKLTGQLNPATINAITDAAATYGVANGMPGTTPGTLAGNLGLRDLGRSVEDQISSGLGAYGAITPVISKTQTLDPSLQAEIGYSNNVNAAAPDPTAAGTHAEDLFNKYLKGLGTAQGNPLKSPASGTGGGVTHIPALAGGVHGTNPNNSWWNYA